MYWVGFVRLFRWFRFQEKRTLLLLVGLGVVLGLVDAAIVHLLFPLIAKLLSGTDGLSSAPLQQVSMYGAVIAILIVSSTIGRYYLISYGYGFAFALGRRVSVDILSNEFTRPIHELSLRNSSEITSVITKINNFIFNIVNASLQGTISAVITIFIMFAVVYTIGLEVLLFIGFIVCIYALITWLLREPTLRHSLVIAKLESLRLQYLQEALSSIRDVKIDNTEAYFIARYGNINLEYFKSLKFNSVATSFPRYLVEGLIFTMLVITGSFLIISRGSIAEAISTLAIAVFASLRLMPHIQQVYYSIATTRANEGVMVDILDLLTFSNARQIVRNDRPKSAASKSQTNVSVAENPRLLLELVNITYRYPGGSKDVFSNFNFRIFRGDKVAIVGRSGVGKTTFLDLVCGFAEPVSGSVTRYIDGKQYDTPIRTAYVSQKTYLIEGTVLENITLGKHIKPEIVALALEISGLQEVFGRDKLTLLNQVGENGALLSGGQRQRIGIARAICRDPDLLILDEAVSALDEEAAIQVIEKLLNYFPMLTLLCVTHNKRLLGSFHKFFNIK